MADVLKPQHAEIVDKIRLLEQEVITAKQRWKKYHNYYAPQELIKESKRVLSFGVGGDVSFEKLICLDNPMLEIKLYDPTPWTRNNIKGILNSSGRKYFKDIQDGLDLSKKIGATNIKYEPTGYAPTNGVQDFYYTPEKNEQGQLLTVKQQWKSFSAFNPDGTRLSTKVQFKNIETIMQEHNWDSVDIIKTDIEGHWYNFANELLEKNIQFKYWVTEIELGLNDNYEKNFEQIKEVCANFKSNYKVVINRKRLKPMLELGFIKNESTDI
tara:strand:- start:104 stop:910 length:807 start_codon:yes stop_codon:yes gene_type:complete